MYMMPYNADLFDDVMSPFDHFFKGMDFRSGMKNFMTTDVIELKDGLKLIMDLPGLKKDDIKIKCIWICKYIHFILNDNYKLLMLGFY